MRPALASTALTLAGLGVAALAWSGIDAQWIAIGVALLTGGWVAVGAPRRRPGVLSEAGHTLLDGVVDPVLAVDAGGAVRYANRAAAEVLGERLVGRPIDGLVPDEVVELCRRAGSGRGGTARLDLTLASGRVTLDVSGEPAGDGGAVLTLRDVTELARTAQLKADLVANASHELRTPLASIRAAVETMNDAGRDDERVRTRAGEVIETNADRLQELIDDLLDLSRLESPDSGVNIERFGLDAVCAQLGKMFERVCGQRRLALEFALGVHEVETDRSLVLLILRNLVDNATKFAHEGTIVRVSATGTDERTLELGVADRGIGIPSELQQRVFERFYQADPARTGQTRRRGSGLGLSIVKHAAQTLGGSVRVESEVGKGTMIRVTLPGCVRA